VTFGCKKYDNKIGILLAQLGTPEAPTPSALRRYLAEFLWDRRVIEVNRLLWWAILHGIILRFRPARSARLYQRIWRPEGSPLFLTTKNQTVRLAQELSKSTQGVEITFGMRYGSPSLTDALDDLLARGVSRLLLLPLYPQYCASTTASTYDAVFSRLLKERWVPTLRVADPYFLHGAYLSALAEKINRALRANGGQPEYLLLSYHGIPQAYVKKGDPYCCMCAETTARLKPLLAFPQEKILHVYQSRFGSDPWLKPYTADTIQELAERGVKRIAVAFPGFLADCLETLDEIGHEASHVFKALGGERLDLIPCLNDDPGWIRAMSEIVRSEIDTWLKADSLYDACGGEIRCPSGLELN
jgi:ferrochelatase